MKPIDVQAIRARRDAVIPQEEWQRHFLEFTWEPGGADADADAVILYGDGDYAAEVYDNWDIEAAKLAEFWARAYDDIGALLEEREILDGLVERLRQRLARRSGTPGELEVPL
jgi:hypothetical protein